MCSFNSSYSNNSYTVTMVARIREMYAFFLLFSYITLESRDRMCISCSLRFCHCYFIQFSLRLFILHRIEFPKGFSLLCAMCLCARDEKYPYLGRIRITHKKKLHINKVCHFRYRNCLFLRFDFFFSLSFRSIFSHFLASANLYQFVRYFRIKP